MSTDLSKLRFTPSHEWIRVEGNLGFVGISDHAQHEVTDVVYVELPPLNKEVKTGDEAATIESVKAAFSIYAPASGKITQTNKNLEGDPGLINRSPYDEGWIYAIELADPAETQSLMDAKAYEAFTKTSGAHA